MKKNALRKKNSRPRDSFSMAILAGTMAFLATYCSTQPFVSSDHGVAKEEAGLGDAGTLFDSNQADSTQNESDSSLCGPGTPELNLHLFDQLLVDLEDVVDFNQKQALVNEFWKKVAKEQNYPLRDESSVLFLGQGQIDGNLWLAGTFNDWEVGKDKFMNIEGTDLHYVKKEIAGEKAEYKLVTDNGIWFKDPLNQNVAWDGMPRQGLGDFNSVVLSPTRSKTSGRIEWFGVDSYELNNRRDVFVYLPPEYDENLCAAYPVLIVHDGNESITRGHFDQVADETIASGLVDPVIMVFVALADQGDRLGEYSCEDDSPGKNYADFLCDTVVPFVDQRYRTTKKPQDRGLIGASLGGLISYAVLFWRNDCFQLAASQSGSFWYADQMMVNRVHHTSPKVTLIRGYLDNGVDNRASTLSMRDALEEQNYPVKHLENLEQEHTWDAWQDRFDEALVYLFPPK